MLESFSIINFNNEAIDYDKLSINENLIGSFDYQGSEGYDNFLIDSETGNVEYIGLSVPQNFQFEKNFFVDNNIILFKHDFNDLLSALKRGMIFQEPNYSILDSKSNRLICISSLEDKAYQVIKINEDFFLLFIDWEYKGFVLKDVTKNINDYNKEKVDSKFEESLNEIFEFVNNDIYDRMEHEDDIILQKLNKLKEKFLNISDSRTEGVINFIDNYIFAYY